MNRQVNLERVLKQLRKVPREVFRKLMNWVEAVETDGLAEARKTPGVHDEPLKGRRRGQRSIRLSYKWRAIYTTTEDGNLIFIEVQEVTAHDYRTKKRSYASLRGDQRRPSDPAAVA